MLLARFNRTARKAGWSKEKIKEVTDKATQGDYDHLNAVLFEALVEIEN